MEIPMAYYQDANSLTQLSDPMFDEAHGPGQAVTRPGIYKCAGCDREIATDTNFPPQNHHKHSLAEGQVRWNLIVCARAEPHT
jgi:hypothetical protein